MSKRLNKDVDWDKFDSNLYLKANYNSILPPDREIVTKLVSFYNNNQPHGLAVEIGAGPNLYPILTAIPYVEKYDIIEYGDRNISYLRSQIQSLDPVWEQWINLLKTLNPIYHTDFQQQLKNKLKVKKDSLYNLPKNKYHLASMHFVSESLSEDLNEFYKANNKVTDAVVKDGLITFSFMENSNGYTSPGSNFPATPITRTEIENSLKQSVGKLKIIRVTENNGLVREGHTGILLALGKK